MNNLLTRAVIEKAATFDKENRTVKTSFASEEHGVLRYFYGADLPQGASRVFEEYISCDPQHWDLTRVKNSNCLYLKNHDRNQQLGKVRKVTFEGKKAYCEVKVLRTEEGDDYLAAVEDDLQPGESFGYVVKKYKVIQKAEYSEDKGYTQLVTPAKLLATEIELFEVSSEATPADPNVGMGTKNSPLMLSRSAIDGDFEWENEPQKVTKKRTKSMNLDEILDLLEPDQRASLRSIVGEKDKEYKTLQGLLEKAERETETTKRELETAQTALQAMRTRSEVSTQYFDLMKRAETLVADQQLSGATFKRYFSGNSDADIDGFCQKQHRLEMLADTIDEAAANPKLAKLRTSAFFKEEQEEESDEIPQEKIEKRQAAFGRR